LNPKKSNNLHKDLAEELGLSEALVSDIVSYYWSNVRKYLESMDEPVIDVENLGVFYTKSKCLQREIQKNEDYVRIINPANLKKFQFYNTAQQRLKRFYSLKQKLEDQLSLKHQFKATKNENLRKDQDGLEH